MEEVNEYTLTADEQAMINPLIETVENLQRDAQAILRAITRMRKLDGNWNLIGNKLVKAAAPAPVVPMRSEVVEALAEAVPNGNG